MYKKGKLTTGSSPVVRVVRIKNIGSSVFELPMFFIVVCRSGRIGRCKGKPTITGKGTEKA